MSTRFTHPHSSRRAPNALFALLAMLLLMGSGLAQAQIGYNSFLVGQTGDSVTMTVSANDTSVDRILFEIRSSPDGSDRFTGPAIQTVSAGLVRQTIVLGPAAGLREVGVCALRPGETSCVPVSTIRVGGILVDCPLRVSPASGTAPLLARASASCGVDTGSPRLVLDNASYGWSLPSALAAPSQSPPLFAEAVGTLTAPGNYPVSISPVLNFAVDGLTAPGALRSIRPATARAEFVVSGTPAPLPSVSISNPTNAQIFSAPASFAIEAIASPGSPGASISAVEFLVNGQSIGIDTAAPYSVAWPSSFAAGSYRLIARATEGSVSVDSAAVTITIAAPTGATQISLSNPPNNARILSSQEFDVQADVVPAANGGPVTQVEFFANGGSIGIDTSSPYAIAWPLGSQPGGYVLSARATQGGVSVQSAQVSIEILQGVVAGNAPPSVELTSPGSGAFINAGTAFAVTAAATDSDGEVIRVQFLLDGQVIGLRTAPPYSLQVPGNLAEGTYELGAIAFDNTGGVSSARPVQIVLRQTPEQLELLSAGAALQISPGQTSRINVLANGTGGGSAGVDLQWQLSGGENATVPPGANCSASDSPRAGSVRTAANGEARIEFLAGCASGGRTLQISVADQPSLGLTVELPGPSQAVTALNPGISGEILVASTGEPTPLAIALTSAAGAPVANALVEFLLEPASAGTVTGSALSDAAGVANGTLVLNASASQASIRVCLAGRADSCVLLPVRSLENAVLAPARETVAPIVRSMIEAPRVQMDFLASRMRQLRNSSGHGFSNDVRLSIGELGLPLSGFGPGDGTESEQQDEQEAASKFGVFVGGDITIAKRGDRDGQTSGGYRAQTRGLTVGVDYRFKPSLVAGAALGALRTQTDLPANGEQQARGNGASLFGQWLPSDAAYVSGVLHFGRNSYDIERFVGANQRLTSETDSRQRAAQLEAGYALATGPMRFTPFLRFEYIRASADPILERGGPDALFIDRIELRNTTFSTGMSFDYAISSRSGVWIPGARIEYFGESLDQDEVLARLVTGNIGLQATEIEALDRRYGMAGLSLQWLTAIKGHPISLYFGFDSSFAREDFKTRRYALSIKVPL